MPPGNRRDNMSTLLARVKKRTTEAKESPHLASTRASVRQAVGGSNASENKSKSKSKSKEVGVRVNSYKQKE